MKDLRVPPNSSMTPDHSQQSCFKGADYSPLSVEKRTNVPVPTRHDLGGCQRKCEDACQLQEFFVHVRLLLPIWNNTAF
jgi:hypothetical protein